MALMIIGHCKKGINTVGEKIDNYVAKDDVQKRLRQYHAEGIVGIINEYKGLIIALVIIFTVLPFLLCAIFRSGFSLVLSILPWGFWAPSIFVIIIYAKRKIRKKDENC
jgi:hypothetical protein